MTAAEFGFDGFKRNVFGGEQDHGVEEEVADFFGQLLGRLFARGFDGFAGVAVKRRRANARLRPGAAKLVSVGQYDGRTGVAG